MSEFQKLIERVRLGEDNRALIKLIDFRVIRDGRYGDSSDEWNNPYPFSEDFKESMVNYLIHGLHPGGFATAMLANDLERALYNSDTHNRTVYWGIAIWVREELPSHAWGSYQAVEDWCADQDGRRTAYLTELEKKYVWRLLENGRTNQIDKLNIDC